MTALEVALVASFQNRPSPKRNVPRTSLPEKRFRPVRARGIGALLTNLTCFVKGFDPEPSKRFLNERSVPWPVVTFTDAEIGPLVPRVFHNAG